MHRTQRVPGILSQQDLLRMAPQRRPLFEMRRQQRQRLRDPLLAPAIECAAGPRHGREQWQHHLRILRRIACSRCRAPKTDASVLNPIADRRRLRPPPHLRQGSLADHCPSSRSRLGRHSFQHVRQAALHDSRMAEVEPHPVGRACGRRLQRFPRAARPNQLLRRRVLRLPVQRVVVALMPVVQKTPHREQKLHRLPEIFAVSRRPSIARLHRPRLRSRAPPSAFNHPHTCTSRKPPGQSLMLGSRWNSVSPYLACRSEVSSTRPAAIFLSPAPASWENPPPPASDRPRRLLPAACGPTGPR